MYEINKNARVISVATAVVATVMLCVGVFSCICRTVMVSHVVNPPVKISVSDHTFVAERCKIVSTVIDYITSKLSLSEVVVCDTTMDNDYGFNSDWFREGGVNMNLFKQVNGVQHEVFESLIEGNNRSASILCSRSKKGTHRYVSRKDMELLLEGWNARKGPQRESIILMLSSPGVVECGSIRQSVIIVISQDGHRSCAYTLYLLERRDEASWKVQDELIIAIASFRAIQEVQGQV